MKEKKDSNDDAADAIRYAIENMKDIEDMIIQNFRENAARAKIKGELCSKIYLLYGKNIPKKILEKTTKEFLENLENLSKIYKK